MWLDRGRLLASTTWIGKIASGFQQRRHDATCEARVGVGRTMGEWASAASMSGERPIIATRDQSCHLLIGPSCYGFPPPDIGSSHPGLMNFECAICDRASIPPSQIHCPFQQVPALGLIMPGRSTLLCFPISLRYEPHTTFCPRPLHHLRRQLAKERQERPEHKVQHEQHLLRLEYVLRLCLRL